MAGDPKIEFSTALLRTLHRLHQQRTDLKSQIERGPRQIKASQMRITEALERVQTIKDRSQAARLVSDRKQLQLAEREARLKDLETKLNTAASNREFSMLQEQIAADKKANEVQSDEILEVLEQLDGIAQELTAAKAELATQQEENEQRIAEVEARQKVVSGELDRVELELKEAETAIPSAAKGDYQRITEARGEDGLAPVEDESCGSCYQTLTTQFIERLRMSNLVRCPNCDAFLYFPEDRRVT